MGNSTQLEIWKNEDDFLTNTLRVFPKGVDIQISKNFHLSEFDCKCDYGSCKFTKVDMRMVYNLQDMRHRSGQPVHLTSAYRCDKHNKKIGGVKNSMHIRGLAVDVVHHSVLWAMTHSLKFKTLWQKHYISRGFFHMHLMGEIETFEEFMSNQIDI